ncbi:hypothetical protein E2C00_27830 [Streptomyces sp. WAC05374]|nr:hypothetical protein E2B92_20685 [Streptomyces sp. WAC05374]TDF51110.1 hypothetical protein E2C00_27830 [Streptomyces sp. WAC05374]TDF52147.1 hypothetical protein E2C02_21335 [Streptomyces sp. WAC05374]
MLIRMRVVSVVSVLGSSDSAAAPAPSSGASCTGLGDGYWRDPYGGVPEGYAAPPRPWAPEDELSVSRLKAGSPGWLRRPLLHVRALGGAHHHTGRRRRVSRDQENPIGHSGPSQGTSHAK